MKIQLLRRKMTKTNSTDIAQLKCCVYQPCVNGEASSLISLVNTENVLCLHMAP